jgi:predicted MPP superfamily phosphohydrolase
VRVVHLSDLHGSPLMVARDLDRAVHAARGLRPDVVAVTGDHLMPYSEGDFQFIVDALARFQVPVVLCLGNHDLAVSGPLCAALEAAGMHPLVDRSLVLDVRGRRVEFTGVNFHWRRAREQLLAALERLPPPEAELRVLLAHDPRLFAWLPPSRFDLVLAGHTHGGQVGVEGPRPWSLLRIFGAFDQGRFERGDTVMWVHRGNWHTGLPPRMGIAAEIVLHRVSSR